MPGFVDSHRHIWKACCATSAPTCPSRAGRATSRTCCTSWRRRSARGRLHGQPHLGAGCHRRESPLLWTGRTSRASPDHTDAVVQALEDSGMRAVFAVGLGQVGGASASWFMRAATEHFDPGPDATLALAAPGPEFTDFEVTRASRKPREAGARITTHVGVGSYGLDAKFEQFGRSGARSRHHLYPLHDAQRHRDS